jgi:spore coat polysaccharide biosynthesis predicted glycosyltransferase SpsG
MVLMGLIEFYVAGGQMLGYGHIKRSTALMDAARNEGFECVINQLYGKNNDQIVGKRDAIAVVDMPYVDEKCMLELKKNRKLFTINIKME